jgi:hypothetical protein
VGTAKEGEKMKKKRRVNPKVTLGECVIGTGALRRMK